MKHIAILSGEGGQGHLSVAKAIQAWCKIWGLSADIFDVLPKINDKVYKVLNKFPKSYNSLFKLTDNISVANIFMEATKFDVERRIKKYKCDLSTYNLVISTHPFLHPICSAKTAMVVLDPTVHASYFAKPHTDTYISFYNKETEKILKAGIPQDDVIVTGPLARPLFYEQAKKPRQEDKIILVTAGGAWIRKSNKYIEMLDEISKNHGYKFVFVCGKDKKFQKERSEEYKKNTNLIFLGWQELRDMANWIGKSSAILAFSIAQMSIEAGIFGKPIFIADYIAGQEDGYKEILVSKKVAKVLYGKPVEKMEQLKTYLTEANPIKNANLTKWQKELFLVPNKFKKYILK